MAALQMPSSSALADAAMLLDSNLDRRFLMAAKRFDELSADQVHSPAQRPAQPCTAPCTAPCIAHAAHSACDTPIALFGRTSQQGNSCVSIQTSE